MTVFSAAVLLLGGVITLLWAFGLVPRAWQAVRASRSAFEVLRDPALGDDRKESLLQGYSRALLSSFLELSIRGAAAIAIPVGLLWALEWVGVVSLEAVLALTLSWPFLLGGVLAGIATFWLLES